MDKLVKIIFAGDTHVGKTSIIERFNNNINKNITSTVGASFCAKTVTWKNKQVALGIWDTAGQERYKSMSSVYFRKASICVLVFDVSNYNSFENVKEWKYLCCAANIDSATYDDFNSSPVYILVGNKTDLPRVVSKKKALDYCVDNNYAAYIETSAHNNEGIKDLFEKLAEEACKIKLPTNNSIALSLKNNSKCSSC